MKGHPFFLYPTLSATSCPRPFTMYPRTKRVTPFSTHRIYQPLPILASHIPFCERASSTILLAHEVSGGIPRTEAISRVALLSVASTTPSRDELLDGHDGDEQCVPEFPSSETRPVTPESISVKNTSSTRSVSWSSQTERIAKPPGEPGRPGEEAVRQAV